MMVRTAFACIALVSAVASFAQTKPPESFNWQSRNSNLKDLSAEFGHLYGTLLEAADQGYGIETYVYKGDTGRNIEAILREERLVAGKYLPREADVYVCSLNPKICKMSTTRDGTFAQWLNGASSDIHLPKLTFVPVIVHREYAKKAQDRLMSIVVNERGGCENYDEACQKYLANLNRVPMAQLEGKYEGIVLVPTLSYRTRVTFVTRTATPPAESTLQKVLDKRPGIQRAIVPEVKLVPQGNEDSTGTEGTRSKILELISHPFSQKAGIPAGRPIVVGVFDTWLDKAHCDIGPAVMSYIDAGADPAGVKREPCGTRGDASDPYDHGTHVVGLIAGSEKGKAGPGINPNAKIYFVRINPDSMRSDNATYLQHVADRLNEVYKSERPDVINLSFYYPFPSGGASDTFLGEIEANKNLTLFVASAGNQSQELRFGGLCAVRPACAGAANLITVAALDLSGGNPKLDSSNYGSAVHIAAPGKNVVSTLSGDRIGVMSGTSQAAPLVAGAASLLLAKNHHLYPEQVKNRLIYTSDLFPSLYSQVHGGRLNITRALNMDIAQLALRSGQTLEGELVNRDSSIAVTDVETRADFHPTWKQIRRLKYEKDLGYYTMFWKPTSKPLQRSFITPQNDRQVIKFSSRTTPPVLQTYTLGDVFDYVAEVAANTQ